MKSLRSGQSFLFLVATFFVILWIYPIHSALAATSVPINNAQGVPVDSYITVTFGIPITNYNIVKSEILLVDTKYPKKSLNFDVIKDTTRNDRIIIIPKLLKSSDSDFFLLDFHKEYKVSVHPNALMYGPVPLGEFIDFTFKTRQRFSDMTKKDLNLLINQYSPSGIQVIIPTKLITALDISYAAVDANKNPLAKPLTNVDITVTSTVNRTVTGLRTFFDNKNWVSAQILRTAGPSVVWNAGYAGDMTALSTDGKTKVGKDIKVRAYDKYDRVIESYTAKIDPKGKKTETFTNDNKLVSTPQMLNELIANGGQKLIAILKVFPLDALEIVQY